MVEAKMDSQPLRSECATADSAKMCRQNISSLLASKSPLSTTTAEVQINPKPCRLQYKSNEPTQICGTIVTSRCAYRLLSRGPKKTMRKQDSKLFRPRAFAKTGGAPSRPRRGESEAQYAMTVPECTCPRALDGCLATSRSGFG